MIPFPLSRNGGAVRRPRAGRICHALAGLLLLLSGWRLAAQTVPAKTAEGFAVPQPGTRFTFPRDHGSHPEFSLEWWYVTGHLFETNGARYGFQVTFFRRAAPLERSGLDSAATATFGDDQIFLAHTALLEVSTGRFIHQERLNRAGWDAASSVDSLEVRNGNWSLWSGTPVDPAPTAQLPLELRASIRAEATLALTLTPIKPLVVFGTNGVSRKAAEPTAASHYLTFTRLKATGTLKLGERVAAVTGEAWMDHEFSSSQLGAGQVGWDWACLQLRDGRELMAYRMRRSDGSVDPHSTLAWIDHAGRVQHTGPETFTWDSTGSWRSAETGATYPAGVRLVARDPVTGNNVTFRLQPLAPGQELRGVIGGLPYWEGACRILDEAGIEIGNAFLELTGYAGSMQGRL